MLEEYLNTRAQLKLIIHLVDIRHTPTKDDIIMNDWIKQKGIGYMVLASKLDKISKNERLKRINDIRQTLDIASDVDIIPFSAKDKNERHKIWDIIQTKLNI